MARKKKIVAATISPPPPPTALPTTDAESVWLALTLIICIGCVLRLTYLTQPIRYDESVTYLYFAKLPWLEAVANYRYPNNHIFHTILVKLCVNALGNEPWVLRLPAFTAGILAIPATFMAARELYGQRVALISAALVSASGVLTLYSTNARGYSLVVFATLVLVWIAARARMHPSTPGWIAYAIVAALGLWTIPIMLYPLGGVTLWFMWTTWRGRSEGAAPFVQHALVSASVATLAAGSLAILLYMPVILRSGIASLIANKFVEASPFDHFLSGATDALGEVGTLFLMGGGLPLGILLGCALVAGAIEHHRRYGEALSLLAGVGVWSALLLLGTHRWPFARVWLFVLPILYMTAAIGGAKWLDQALPRFSRPTVALSTTAVLLAVLLSGVTFASGAVRDSRETGTLFDAEAVVRTLQGTLHDGDRLVTTIPANAPVSYWMDKLGIDSSYMTSDARIAHRFVVVVNGGEGEQPVELLNRLGLGDTTRFKTPLKIAEFPQAMIVAVEYRQE